MAKLIIREVLADSGDPDGLVDSFISALKGFGIFLIDDPRTEGSDQYGFILSNRKLTNKEVKEISEEYD